MVATPVYSKVELEYMKSILALKDFYVDKQVDLKFDFTYGNSIIHDARNILVDRFLDSDCDYLFFIDSDMVFDPVTFDETLKTCFDDDKDIVAGICPKRQMDWEFLYYAIQKGKKDLHNYNSVFNHTFKFTNEEVDLSKPLEIDEIGTGFMCIKRSLLEDLSKKITKKYATEKRGKTELITFFFDFSIDDKSKIFIGEDINFCRVAKSFGYRIWMCPWVLIGHKGTYLYSASFKEAFEVYKEYVISGEYKSNKLNYGY